MAIGGVVASTAKEGRKGAWAAGGELAVALGRDTRLRSAAGWRYSLGAPLAVHKHGHVCHGVLSCPRAADGRGWLF
eukprot:SAG11_NODE_217_length_12229_cov_9.152185_14_plen_76_part_00